MTKTLACTLLLTLSLTLTAQDKTPPDKVRCVFPGTQLSAALEDLALQLGAQVEYAGEDEVDGETPVWVVAAAVPPGQAAALVGDSAGVVVRYDAQAGKLRCAPQVEATDAPSAKGYDVSALCGAYRDYRKRYAPPLPPDEAPSTAAEELLSLVHDVAARDTGGNMGSPVGSRLVLTRTAAEHEITAELLRLLQQESGGESAALAADRRNREQLRTRGPRGLAPGSTLGSALWRLFESSVMPVYIHHSLLETMYFDEDAYVQDEKADATELLLRLAREHEFAVDSSHGAMRLHAMHFEGAPSYRVYAMDAMLAELEIQYANMAAGTERADEQSLRSRGGIQVVLEALDLQMDSAGHMALIVAYGARLVVVGGCEIIDAATAILTEMGWKEPAAPEGGSK